MLYNSFPTPEAALEHLLDKGEKSYRGSAWINVFHNSVCGGEVCGFRPVTRNTLRGRIYTTKWCDGSVAIKFLDSVWLDHITGRSYPEKVRCVTVMLPFVTHQSNEELYHGITK